MYDHISLLETVRCFSLCADVTKSVKSQLQPSAKPATDQLLWPHALIVEFHFVIGKKLLLLEHTITQLAYSFSLPYMVLV